MRGARGLRGLFLGSGASLIVGGPIAPPVELDPFVTAIWGQSEHQHILNEFDDGVGEFAQEPLVAQDRVTFWWHDRTNDGAAGVQSVTLNDTTAATSAVTKAMVAMANVFMRQLPNRDVRIVLHAMSGTNPTEIMDDTFVASGTKRRWQDDWALNAAATADGNLVAHPWHSWFAAPGSWADAYGQNMFAFIKGRDHVTGADLVYSAASPLDVNGIFVSRTLRDLYTHDPVWVATSGAHVFVPTEDLENAVTVDGGGSQISLTNKQASTESWREVIRNPALSAHFSGEVFPINGYQNGFDNGDGTWTDQAHPWGGSDEGINRMARMIAHAILRGAGRTAYTVPVIDNAEWQADGSYMEFWSSAGAITTFRGGTGPGSDHPHWTDVLGVEVDGVPAQRAEIQGNGRVRVFPISGSFTSSTVVQFGRGGASGWLQHDADAFGGLWNDYPIVDVGLSDLAGVPLGVLPDPDVMASTIVGAPTFQTSDSGPYFLDPADTGAGRTAFTGVFVGTMDADQAAGVADLISISGLRARLEALSGSQSMRLSVRDSAGKNLVSAAESANGVFSLGVQFTAVVSIDLVAGFGRVWVDGVLVLDETFTSVPQTFNDNRNVSLAANNTGSDQFKGTIERMAVWFDSTTDGSEPTGTPYKEIAGEAATVNADPWKLGADAT